MNPYKYSVISHQDFVYCNPLSVAKMEALIAVLELDSASRVLDIGAGKAELLIRLVECYGVSAVGVDRNTEFLQIAREQAAKRIPDGNLQLLEIDVADFQAEPASFDLAICMGASEVFGGYSGTLQHLASYVKPGGQILVAEAYWKREPEEAYLKAFGVPRDEYVSHAENVAIGVAQGLIPYYSAVSSDDDWDTYEWLHSRAIERYARQHPDDPDVPALLTRIREWRNLYLRWGRDTFGFALYLFQK